MNTKKKTVLVAAFIVAILALAGVGYAATHPAYEGKTTAHTETMDVDYVIVSLDNQSYTGHTTKMYITYDTVTEYNEITTQLDKTFTYTGSTPFTSTVSLTVPATTSGYDVDTFKLSITGFESFTTTYPAYKIQYSTDSGTNWTDLTTTSGYGSAAGDVITTSGLTFSWRVIPTITNIESGVVLDDSQITSLDTSVIFPALTYTVTATQYTA